MSNESAMRDLFDRWERVWHEGQYDLIPSCVGPTYIRHDEKGDRTGKTGSLCGGDRPDSAGAAEPTLRCLRSLIRRQPCVVPLYAQVY
jgi:hypothetical protein